ncbi:non-homologous end joining protein Ku [Achromobacter spanius]|uniref:Non-homologous end joining protein Ku n=1 Tax=Achromobacter spanius TaxID=217203 RepID=A0AAW3I9V7_9BURK|nr:Ku protein [Achromobacter spanius]KNE29545.1 DNA-binding protein [Achromobacter spanius]
MATRTIWKGAISFGLVHIPVGLHTATTESGVDFDWLDKRSMDPVGYKRINKRTGKEIDKDNIVKGVEYEDGQYVIISPEEIADAYPRTTQTIEIQQFVDADDVSFVYLERPYYVAPINKGQKVYALLRDTLAKTGKIGIAKVVIQTKQHLAALIPSGDALVLNLMRWGDEVKPLEGLDLPKVGAKGMAPSASELKMAKMLVEDMSGKWDPEEFKDEFKAAVMDLVARKVKAGKTETVVEPQEEAPAYADNVIDLTELLQRSLKGGKTAKDKTPARKSAKSAKKTAKTTAKTAAKSMAKQATAKTSTKAPRKAAKQTRTPSSSRKAA